MTEHSDIAQTRMNRPECEYGEVLYSLIEWSSGRVVELFWCTVACTLSTCCEKVPANQKKLQYHSLVNSSTTELLSAPSEYVILPPIIIAEGWKTLGKLRHILYSRGGPTPRLLVVRININQSIELQYAGPNGICLSNKNIDLLGDSSPQCAVTNKDESQRTCKLCTDLASNRSNNYYTPARRRLWMFEWLLVEQISAQVYDIQY